MSSGFSATPRKEGTWTKLVIFAAIYCLILESTLQLALVLFLYGAGKVDSKMTASLVLALVSAILSIPLISLQSLVAWQYNKIGGFGEQKTVLHNVCTYVLRLDLMMWLATCVSGLIVAAQQVYCLPEGTHDTFWRVGMSCSFHRATVIVSVVSLVTVCTLYCARELCDRPYDVSIIGIYRRPMQLKDGSIFSGHSWDSDETLRNEILNLCRQHDGKAGEEPWSVDPLANKVRCHPSIRHPAPVRLRPQLRVNTAQGSEYGEITSGTSISPDDTLHASPGESDFFPISRTSTVMTSQTSSELRNLLSEFLAPKVPPIPKQYTNHKRGKSSLSSLKRFFPKTFPLSLPLSSDPQIRALADPNAASDVEKQVVTPATRSTLPEPISTEAFFSNLSNSNGSPTEPKPTKPEGHARTMTMNSADAPEVVVQKPEPVKVRRSQTAIATFTPNQISIHHPHHPNYIPPPAMPANINPRKYSLSSRQNSPGFPSPESSRRSNARPPKPMHQHPVRSTTYQFDQPLPRHTQSQHQPYYITPPARWASLHTFDPNRVMSPAPRRNDVEIIYPSTRRPRSSTHGGPSGPLSCIMESTSTPRASVDESKMARASEPTNVIDQTTYRGANRTSMMFY